jgi:predicted O-methyltransferase YrrM
MLTLNISKALETPGWMSEIELLWLAETASLIPEGGAIVEIGSLTGRSACGLAANTAATVYCVDTWNGFGTNDQTFAAFRANTSQYTNIIPVHTSSVLAANAFARERRRFDFVFIDAEHDAINLRRDIAAWQPLLAENAVFSGHDYDEPTWPDVKPVVDELIPGVNVVGQIWIAPARIAS